MADYRRDLHSRTYNIYLDVYYQSDRRGCTYRYLDKSQRGQKIEDERLYSERADCICDICVFRD